MIKKYIFWNDLHSFLMLVAMDKAIKTLKYHYNANIQLLST